MLHREVALAELMTGQAASLPGQAGAGGSSGPAPLPPVAGAASRGA
jgi:hypothetical protein